MRTMPSALPRRAFLRGAGAAGLSLATEALIPARAQNPEAKPDYALRITPVLHRHTFEVVKVGDKPTSGVLKDTLNIPRFTTAEIDFIADDPGATLFHCHHQDHQDEGFMGLITYAI